MKDITEPPKPIINAQNLVHIATMMLASWLLIFENGIKIGSDYISKYFFLGASNVMLSRKQNLKKLHFATFSKNVTPLKNTDGFVNLAVNKYIFRTVEIWRYFN